MSVKWDSATHDKKYWYVGGKWKEFSSNNCEEHNSNYTEKLVSNEINNLIHR